MNDATYQSFRRARAVLDAALARHGGVPEVDISARFTGQLIDEGHYDIPYAVQTYLWCGSLVMRAGGAATRLTQFEDNPAVGQTSCEEGFGRHVPPGATGPVVNPREVLRQCRALQRALPHALLRQALAHMSSLRWIGSQMVDHAVHDVIGFIDDDGQAASLSVDYATHLLARWERLVAHPQLGDTSESIAFGSYQAVNGVQIPTHIIERWLNEDSAETRDITLTDIQSGRLLDFPGEPARARSAGWLALTTIEPPDRTSGTVVQVAPDLYLVELPDEDVKTAFAVFDDFVIALDAPLCSAAGEAILAAVRAHAPGKPVRYAVFSHHHPHYLGGLRPFIAEGATLVTTPGNVALLRDYATRRHELEPDRLQRAPRELSILTVEKRHVFSDHGHTLELHDIGPSTAHTREFLIYYFPRLQLLVEGDLAAFPESGEVCCARTTTTGLASAIAELGLDVRSIIQTWPLRGQKRIATIADLDASLAAKAAQDKGGAP